MVSHFVRGGLPTFLRYEIARDEGQEAGRGGQYHYPAIKMRFWQEEKIPVF
jgi:hypothetical protein